MPQLFNLLTGNALIPGAITFLVGTTITKVSKNAEILTKWYIPEAIYTSQTWPLIVPPPEARIVGVQIRLVKKLQGKRQEPRIVKF